MESMVSDSDSSDEETQMQELRQLTEVIRADNALLTESSLWSSQDSSSLSLSVDAPSSSLAQARDKLTNIETAIALNKLLNDKYIRLENLLKNRLSECEKRLEKFKDSPNNSGTSTSTSAKLPTEPKFRYVNCGKPYFRDARNFPAPDNEDTKFMNQLGMIDLSMVSSVTGWSIKDKTQFLNILLDMSKAHRAKELKSKIAQLKRDAKRANSKSKKHKNATKQALDTLEKEMEAIKKKSLSEIALSIEEDYDWDLISCQLKGRHSAQEYESLWKLFLHPSINKSPWTKVEHVKLQQLASENNNQDWDKIAKELNTGRTGYQCFVYFRTNTSHAVTGLKWTTEEEEYLKRLIQFYKAGNYIPWSRIAATMESRTKIQIYNKYASLIVKRKGRYLPEEDSVILACVKKYGKNYAKIAEHIPGRSARQIQVRYTLLNKSSTVSVVWTPEEDRKLLEVMSNADAIVNYANITKYFPGKNRYNVRSRHITLQKWLKRHHLEEIDHAPRRAARRLSHGQGNLDVKQAVDNLKARLEAQLKSRNKNKITMDSTEEEIEAEIIVTLAKEVNQEKNRQELENEVVEKEPLERPPANEKNMHMLLALLRAKLNKNTYEQCGYAEKYPGLLSAKFPSSSVRTYSKKATEESPNAPDIWGEKPLAVPRYCLPPNYATITACRKLMACATSGMPKPNINLSMLEKNCPVFREQKRLLMERFRTLFLWPMMLSTTAPIARELPQTSSSVPAPKKPESMNDTYLRNQWLNVRPMFRETDEMDDGNIDLPVPELALEQRINIPTLHIGNDDFMYLPNEKDHTVEDPVTGNFEV